MKTLILKPARKTDATALKILAKPHAIRLVEGENVVADDVDVAALQAIAKANGFTIVEVAEEDEEAAREDERTVVVEDRAALVVAETDTVPAPAPAATPVEERPRARRVVREEPAVLDIPAEG